jgi:hypothetical protein
MPTDELITITGYAALAFLVPLLVWGFVALQVLIFFRKWSRRRAEIKRHKAAGTFAPSGFFVGRQLPLHYDALAGVGSGGEAPVTVGDHILRPAIGVRLFILGLAATIMAFLVQPGLAPSGLHEAMRELPVPLLVPQLVLLLGAAWGVVYIFGFEARYNTDMLIVTRLFQRREYRWKHLDWLKDDGGYDLVLTFTPSGKAKVLKHVVGVEAFKAVAEGHAKRNRNKDAGAARG